VYLLAEWKSNALSCFICVSVILYSIPILNIESTFLSLSSWHPKIDIPTRPWLAWKEASKVWAGSGHPCSKEGMEIFYAATTITLGGKLRGLTGGSPLRLSLSSMPLPRIWFEGLASNVWRRLCWVAKIDLTRPFTTDHLSQFVELWSLIVNV
jgi:hypothetical protein